MTVRAVEGQKLWTGWTAITVDQLNKVISLNLRDENNLIEYDVGDDEIYVDLQLGDEIRPTSDFPVWVTVGRAITDNGWWMTGTILVAKTTSGDNIKLFYCDDWKLYIDNGTWTFKQIYLKSEVDALLALKQDKLTAWDNITIDENNVISCTCSEANVVIIEYSPFEQKWGTLDPSLINDWTICVFANGSWEGIAWDIYDFEWNLWFTINETMPSRAIAWGQSTWVIRHIDVWWVDERVFFPWEWVTYAATPVQ